MANKNPTPPKNRKKTQFGAKGGNKPNKPSERGYHPMNVRAAVRHIAAQDIDHKNPDKSFKKLLEHHTFSVAEELAYKRVKMAMEGDNHALDKVEDACCGKMEDTLNVKTKTPLDPAKKAEYKKKFTKASEVFALLDAAIREKTQGDA